MMQRFSVSAQPLWGALVGVTVALVSASDDAIAGPRPGDTVERGGVTANATVDQAVDQGAGQAGSQIATSERPTPNDQGAAEGDDIEAQEELSGPWEPGPKKVDLGHEIIVELPEGYAYLPAEPSKKLLEMNGSFGNDGVVGLFASTDPNDSWFIVSSYDDSGFIKDDEELDGEEILTELREGLEYANEVRQENGFKPLALDGWAEAPRYDKAQHQLVWALIVSDADGKSVNLNTRILGRRGYVSLNLVTDPTTLTADRHHATKLLALTQFNSGARYEDFDADSDKVAEYGLAGLVMAGAGLGAAKVAKLGLLAKFSKVILAALIAGKKFIVLGAVAVFALARKFMSSRNAAPPVA